VTATQQLPASERPLLIQGKATDLIWLMQDGEEPHVIGVRLDSGDAGVVYLTRQQALDLADQLKEFAGESEIPLLCKCECHDRGVPRGSVSCCTRALAKSIGEAAEGGAA
jgi:hypothetical protein